MAIIVASLVSVFGAAFTGALTEPITWWGDYRGAPETNFQGASFWIVFAVFFPASTGIMAGANMSGDLKNPRKAIPIGTMSAIGLSLIIYLALAWWLAKAASMETLTENHTVMIDKALSSPLVLAGLLGATFSSALSSLVGAPRILQALGEHRITPYSEAMAAKTVHGEPRNAMLVTGVLVLGALMLRDLNAVAPLITMFFLITYAMINVVVLIEQTMGLLSFRPLFRIPRAVSLLGAVGCIGVMFIVNPLAAAGAVAAVLAIHWILVRRGLKAPFGDVRSGLYVALAERAARAMAALPPSRERTWRSHMLVPVESPERMQAQQELITQIAYPRGLVKLVGLASDEDQARHLRKTLTPMRDDLDARGVFASLALVEAADFSANLRAGIETLQGQFFKPNVLFLQLPQVQDRQAEALDAILAAQKTGMGVLLFASSTAPATSRDIVLHLDNQGPDWTVSMDLGNLDLALLSAYKLASARKAGLTFLASYKGEENAAAAEEYCIRLADLARLPRVGIVTHNVKRPKSPEGEADARDDASHEVPRAALHVLPMTCPPDFEALRKQAVALGGSCLFALDSGNENALA